MDPQQQGIVLMRTPGGAAYFSGNIVVAKTDAYFRFIAWPYKTPPEGIPPWDFDVSSVQALNDNTELLPPTRVQREVELRILPLTDIDGAVFGKTQYTMYCDNGDPSEGGLVPRVSGLITPLSPRQQCYLCGPLARSGISDALCVQLRVQADIDIPEIGDLPSPITIRVGLCLRGARRQVVRVQ